MSQERSAETIATQRRLIEALDDRELDLLTIFVLLDEHTSRSRWRDAAAAHGIRRNRRQALTAKDLLPLCERLEEARVFVSSHSSTYYHVPPPIVMIVLSIAHARERLEPLARSYEPRPRGRAHLFSHERNPRSQLRVAVVQQKPRTVADVLARLYVRNRRGITDFIAEALGSTPRPAWIDVLPETAWPDYLRHVIEQARTTLLPLDPSVVRKALQAPKKDKGAKALRLEAARWFTLRAQTEPAAQLDELPRWGKEGVSVLEAFVSGDYALAAERGDAAVAAMKSRKHKVLPGIEGVFHVLALQASSSTDPRAVAGLAPLLEAISASGKSEASDLLLPLSDIFDRLRGEARESSAVTPPLGRISTFVSAMVWLLHLLWLHRSEPPHAPKGQQSRDDEYDDLAKLDEELERALEEATGQRIPLFGREPSTSRHRRALPTDQEAIECARTWEARARQGDYVPVAREFAAIAAAFEGARGQHLAGAFDPPAVWETALASLEEFLARSSATTTALDPSAARHLVWELVLTDDIFIELLPRIRESAHAKKGQKIAVTRLLEGNEAELLGAQDRAVLATVDQRPHRWRGHITTHPVLGRRSLVSLVGHPRVIDQDGRPVTVERGTPTVLGHHHNHHTRVELRPAALVYDEIAFECPAPGRVVVYERPSALEPLVSALGSAHGFEVPDEARERLARTLTRLSAAAPVEIDGDLEAGGVTETRTADPRPVLQLSWDGSALAARVRVAPLGPGGPHVRPGSGAASLLGEIKGDDGVRLARCQRDLSLETERHRALLDACPALCGFADAPLSHRAPDLPDALDVMLELDALGDDIHIEWAAGQKLDLPFRADLRHLKVEVGLGTEWLSVDATLEVDETTVLQFVDLLCRPAQARYLPLGRGRFVALSERLQRHLDALAGLGTPKGKKLRASATALPALEGLAEDVEHFAFDAKAQLRLQTLGTIASWVPRVPRGFGSILRDYQRDGFIWMARLARAEFGACLADDMGLGKTIQALALCSYRARQGPALVVCPTSVVLNWASEAQRFAPSLRVHPLADASDRVELLASLRPHDVVICSYGLLTTEAAALRETNFATIVFDEAHALKNQTTKRAQSARRLRADFRLALTGTPIENHLGELWSLFHVIVPGLLGSKTHFEATFAGPIGGGDRERTMLLRSLVRPFLLRRTKAQVLDELPPRSEATIRVEPSPKQQAFYEAMRRQAWERVATIGTHKARMQILAEITRLRQAAIDPRLVDPSAGPKGAKIELLMERLLELRDEGHRALVFTQFLGSMELVRARLNASGIEFFELDGSTSTTERAKRIEAFQAGEGDVFLLSLRAGGLGVNLTGADYVFHLDPWWNPAVEDQATDRAHRIGQARPVTVYRLVTRGTIEDKIIALHASKRQLADDLLTDLQHAKTLDLDALRQLLEE